MVKSEAIWGLKFSDTFDNFEDNRKRLLAFLWSLLVFMREKNTYIIKFMELVF